MPTVLAIVAIVATIVDFLIKNLSKFPFQQSKEEDDVEVNLR